MAQRHAAVVEVVYKLNAEDRAEKGRMRQGSRTKCLGKVAQVGAEDTEPLKIVLVRFCTDKPAILENSQQPRTEAEWLQQRS